MSKHQKLETEATNFVNVNNSNIINFYFQLFQLKNTIRTGWPEYHGMKSSVSETVADHNFSSTFLGYMIAKELGIELDYDKVLKMILFHEVGEIYLGDLVSYNNKDISPEDKFNQEKEAVKKVCKDLKIGNEIFNTWIEFEKAETPEAKFANGIDQLEAVFQAWTYKKYNLVGDRTVVEFREYARSKIDPECVELLELLDSIR